MPQKRLFSCSEFSDESEFELASDYHPGGRARRPGFRSSARLAALPRKEPETSPSKQAKSQAGPFTRSRARQEETTSILISGDEPPSTSSTSSRPLESRKGNDTPQSVAPSWPMTPSPHYQNGFDIEIHPVRCTSARVTLAPPSSVSTAVPPHDTQRPTPVAKEAATHPAFPSPEKSEPPPVNELLVLRRNTDEASHSQPNAFQRAPVDVSNAPGPGAGPAEGGSRASTPSITMCQAPPRPGSHSQARPVQKCEEAKPHPTSVKTGDMDMGEIGGSTIITIEIDDDEDYTGKRIADNVKLEVGDVATPLPPQPEVLDDLAGLPASSLVQLLQGAVAAPEALARRLEAVEIAAEDLEQYPRDLFFELMMRKEIGLTLGQAARLWMRLQSTRDNMAPQ